MIVNNSNLENVKKLIRNTKDKLLIQAQDALFNRKILEFGNFKMLVFPSVKGIKKKIRRQDVEFDIIMAKIACKNNISIALDLSQVINLPRKEKAERFREFIFIIKLCRKAGANIQLLNFNDKHDALCLMQSLGSSSSQAREAISF